MLTRCPACDTVFLLRPDQLRARQGMVRCGNCLKTFNALDHLIEPDPGAGDPATAPPAVAAPDPAAVPPAGHFAAVGTDADIATTPAAADDTPPSSFSHLEFDIPDPRWTAIEDMPAAWDGAQEPTVDDTPVVPLRLDLDLAPSAPADDDAFEPRIGAADPQSAALGAPRVDFSAMMAAAGERLAADTNAPASAAAPPVPAEAPIEAVTLDADEIAARADEPPPEARTEPTLAPLAAGDTGTEPAEDTQALPPLHAVEPPDPAHLDAAYGREPNTSPLQRLALGLGLTVLTVGLAAQSAYVFRERIARVLPDSRPYYEAACAQLGCTMPLPQDAPLINIDSPDLQSEPRQPGRYVFHATIQNRAGYPQAWPHVELTLTDTRDRALVRRVLAPADWLPAAARQQAAFAAGSEVTVRLAFDAPGVAATGYRVYVFYP